MRTRNLYFPSLVRSIRWGSFRSLVSHSRFRDRSIPRLCFWDRLDTPIRPTFSNFPLVVVVLVFQKFCVELPPDPNGFYPKFLQGMEVQVLDLSSDSEDEVSAHSPQHKRPARQEGPGADRGLGNTGVDSLSRQEGEARLLHEPSDAVKKGKEKVGEGKSAWAAGPPKLGGESLGASGTDPWSALVSKCKAGDGGDVGARCWGDWGDWGDQLRNSVPVLQQRSEEFPNGCAASGDHWKGILGAIPADPANTLRYPFNAGKRENEVGMLSQDSLDAREVSGCDDFLMEESSSAWLSRIKGLNFPFPDERQLRTKQLEDDEVFARMLQEQLNQEQPGSQHSEAVVILDYSNLNIDVSSHCLFQPISVP